MKTYLEATRQLELVLECLARFAWCSWTLFALGSCRPVQDIERAIGNAVHLFPVGFGPDVVVLDSCVLFNSRVVDDSHLKLSLSRGKYEQAEWSSQVYIF